MKISVAILMLLFLAAAHAAPVSDRRAFALSVLKKYSPNGYEVIDVVERTPWAYKLSDRSIQMGKPDFMPFVTGTEPYQIVASLLTAVHESAHNYARKMPWYVLEERKSPWRESSVLYVKRGDSQFVPFTPIFPAAESAQRVPERFRNYRYDTYVVSKNAPGQTTQQQGVYGLLDEFNAYQVGTRTGVDMLAWFEREGPQTPEAWILALQSVEGVYSARAQFKLFILAWLAEAKDKHAEMYRAFLANKDAVRAFLRIDAEYEATIHRYLKERAALLKRLRARGVTVTEDEHGISFGNRGLGTATAEYSAWMAELAKPRWTSLEQDLRRAAGG